MLFLALISVVAAYSGKYKERAQCYASGEPGDRVYDPTAFEDKEHASREAAMTECAEACDKNENCHFAEFYRNSNNNLASCHLWGSDCWEESLDDAGAGNDAVYVKSGDLENWKKYDDSETVLPAKGALGSLCFVPGDDPTLGDKNCNDGLLCARKGYGGRDFGGCASHGVVGPPFSQHCCSTPPAVQADGSSGSGASGSEEETSSAGSEDGSANNDAVQADSSSGSGAAASGYPSTYRVEITGDSGAVAVNIYEKMDNVVANGKPVWKARGKEQYLYHFEEGWEIGSSYDSKNMWYQSEGALPDSDVVWYTRIGTRATFKITANPSDVTSVSPDRPLWGNPDDDATAGSEDEASSAGSEDGSANNDAGGADGSSGSGASDACTAGHDARPGSTSSERCLALSGCCYDVDTDHCGTCTDAGWDYVVVRHRDDNSCECVASVDPCLNDDVCFEDPKCKGFTVVRHKDDNSCECLSKADPCLNDGVCVEDATCEGSTDLLKDSCLNYDPEDKFACIKSLGSLRGWCMINWDNCYACGGVWKRSRERGFCRKGRLQDERLKKCKTYRLDDKLCKYLGCKPKTRKNKKPACSGSGVSFVHLE